MLTRLRLENFKAWDDTGDVELKPITGFLGTNSSGKSSLIQSLLLLKQTAESSDRGEAFNFVDSRAYADMGDFASVAHGHQVDRAVSIALDWNDERTLHVRDDTEDGGPVAESSRLGFQVASRMETAGARSRVTVDRMAYSVGGAVFGMRQTAYRRYEVFSENANFEFVSGRERHWAVTSPVKCYGFPDRVRANYLNAEFLSDLEFALEERLENTFHLGPIRAYPQRTYMWAGSQPRDTGRAGEYAIDALLAARERGRTFSRGVRRERANLEEYVAHWLRRIGLVHEFRVERIAEDSPLYRVKVRKSRRAVETLIPDVGFGVSQILPALVLCFYAPEGSTVILEQPEIHLHPLAQSGLADALIDAYQKRGVQIIVESHSEHLLRRIQRRISEETISQDHVGMYFCSQDSGGASQIDRLELDEFGNISNWPENFFGDQFGEIAAMSEAGMKRRRGGE